MQPESTAQSATKQTCNHVVQVAIAIGTLKQGVLGGLLAGLCFILPGLGFRV